MLPGGAWLAECITTQQKFCSSATQFAVFSVHCALCSVQCAVRSVQCSVCKKCAATQLMQDMRRQFVSEVFDKFEHITGIITITIEGITKFIPRNEDCENFPIPSSLFFHYSIIKSHHSHHHPRNEDCGKWERGSFPFSQLLIRPPLNHPPPNLVGHCRIAPRPLKHCLAGAK